MLVLQVGGHIGGSPIVGYVKIDDIDKDIAARRCSRHGEGYATQFIDGANTLIHRVIAERIIGRPLKKGEDVDHINHDKYDNRRKNLRVVPHFKNIQHRAGLDTNNTSGFRGAAYHKQSGRYIAHVGVNGKQVYLGYYATAQEAGSVAATARKRYGFLGEDCR